MLTLIAAALVTAQPAPATNPHAQHSTMQHGQAAMQHEQHQGMKDCCKDCCKDMKGHEAKAQPKPGA
jgi:hypothetical protein